MNRFYSAILLLAFVYSIIRPAIPLIEYQVYKEYIAEELCINKDVPEVHCDGKCHLKKEIEKVNKEEQDTSPTAPSKPQLKIEEYNYLYDSKESIKIAALLSKLEAHVSKYVNLYSDIELDLDSPPPKC